MKNIKELFGKRKDTSSEETKGRTARMVWDRIGSMVGDGGNASFSTTEGVSPQDLPEDLKTWDYLSNIEPPFIFSISSNFGRVVKVISGTRYLKTVMRGPNDTNPMITEGTVDSTGNEVPFTTQFQDPLEFTRKLSVFLDNQRQKAQAILG